MPVDRAACTRRAVDPQLTTAGRRPRRRLGLRRDEPRHRARRHAAHDRDALRRHAARARGRAPTAAASTRPSSIPATRPRRSAKAWSATVARAPAPCSVTRRASPMPRRAARRRTPTPQGIAAPEVGLIVKYDKASGQWQDELGRNWNNGVRFSCPTTTCSPSTPTRRRRRRCRRTPASARRSSTWSRTRRSPATSTSATPRRGTRCASRGPGVGVSAQSHRAAAHLGRVAHHRPRRRDRAAAPSEQAHRLQRAGPSPPGTIANDSLATPVGMAVSANGAHALRRGLRLEQGRRLRHRDARERHASSRTRARTTSRSAAAGPRGLVARRGATAGSTC